MSGVFLWWLFLCLVATVNVTTWALVARSLAKHRSAMSAGAYAASHIQLVLSGVYVFGCAFRSILPVYDVPRLGLFNTWLSSVAVGRSVATVAELCFVGQWAFLLHAAARSMGSSVARVISLLLVPLIAVAETCSWYAVLTTWNLGHVAENSIWAITAVLGIIGMVALVPHAAARLRLALIAWSAVGVLYVGFMFTFDVPTYWARHVADEASDHQYLTLPQGLADVAHHRVVSHRWDDWKTEIVWMSLYFSIAVWLSISLIPARGPATRMSS
jgi:hypothetical protein